MNNKDDFCTGLAKKSTSSFQYGGSTSLPWPPSGTLMIPPFLATWSVLHFNALNNKSIFNQSMSCIFEYSLVH